MTHTAPAADSAARLPGLSLGELMEADLPPRTPILAPWLMEKDATLIWAAAGTGKTWLGLSIALAVAGGGTLFGHWRAPEARRVLYLDGEMYLEDMKTRIELLIDAAAQPVPRDNFRIWSRQSADDESFPGNLTAPEDRARLLETVEAYKPALVVIDNWDSLAEVEDENSTAAFKPMRHLFDALGAAGAASILLHHARKNGDNYRGSSAIAAPFSTTLGLTTPKLRTRGGAAFTLRFDKDRSGNAGADFSAHLVEGRWETKDAEEDARTEKLNEVVAALRSHQHHTQAELGDAVGMQQPTVSKRLRDAQAAGLIDADEIAQCWAAANSRAETCDDFT